MPDRTIQNLFLSHAEWLDQTPQPLKNRKAIEAIKHCRTAVMGTNRYACSDRHQVIEQHHSCRHRSCYLCAQRKRLEWVERQKRRLLDTPHFHVVFTLPHEYLDLWRYNEEAMTRLIFQCSRESLITLLQDTQHQGFTPGVLMALHTWGRQLSLHPHTHCLVTAGGLDAKNEWQDSGDYLLPVRVLKRVYRGKFQSMIKEAVREGTLKLPAGMTAHGFKLQHAALYRKEWSVRIEERYEHGKGVVVYLSRYLKGGPLNPKQLSTSEEGSLTMCYLDHRDKRIKNQRLSMKELIRRLLQHVPPQGQHTIRYYGLYAPSAKKRYSDVRERFGTVEEAGVKSRVELKDLLLYCNVCGRPARLFAQRWKSQTKGNSINKEGLTKLSADCVQQGDVTYFSKADAIVPPDT